MYVHLKGAVRSSVCRCAAVGNTQLLRMLLCIEETLGLWLLQPLQQVNVD